MHNLRRPSFFLAKSMGAPYGPLLGSIRFESNSNVTYFFSFSTHQVQPNPMDTNDVLAVVHPHLSKECDAKTHSNQHYHAIQEKLVQKTLQDTNVSNVQVQNKLS